MKFPIFALATAAFICFMLAAPLMHRNPNTLPLGQAIRAWACTMLAIAFSLSALIIAILNIIRSI